MPYLQNMGYVADMELSHRRSLRRHLEGIRILHL